MSDLAILPVCYCAAHSGAHIHLPHMIDGQYGLRVAVLEPIRPPAPPRFTWTPHPERKNAGLFVGRCPDCGGTWSFIGGALRQQVEAGHTAERCARERLELDMLRRRAAEPAAARAPDAGEREPGGGR